METTLGTTPLNWPAFLDVIKGLSREALSEDCLFELVQRLVIDTGLLAPHIQFNPDGYARNVLFRDDKLEVICLCWEPGQATAVHSHGRSFGVAYVHEGTLLVTGYRRLDRGEEPGKASLQASSEILATVGSLTMDRVGSIHRLGNPSHATRRAVSLHFYAGPLDEMEVYDLTSDTFIQRPMQAEPLASS